MIPRPAYEGWNREPSEFERLADLLEEQAEQFVEDVEYKPGGAVDAARIELAQYTGTVPVAVNEAILKAGLEIHTVGGYKTVGVMRPERKGGSLPESEEVSR